MQPNSSQHFTATTQLDTPPSAKQNPDSPSWNLLFSYISLLCHSFSCLQSNLKTSSPVPGTQALWLSLYMDTLPSEDISLQKKEFLVSTLQMTKFIPSSYT